MLDAIYGGSQNYAKSSYEMHAHLAEVCGVFAKHMFKRKDVGQAEQFLPKIFAWSVALLRKMQPGFTELEDLILRKFPDCCSYCLKKPCACWSREKPTMDEGELRRLYYSRAPQIRRSLNDFQLMFREIYGDSWRRAAPGGSSTDVLRILFVRLMEEVGEVGESIRFHHLYPENFANEVADVIAWWFALTSTFEETRGEEGLLAEDLLWHAYPGQCPHCQMLPCLCRPGPVRELMSRPIPGQHHRFDLLTSVLNQTAFQEDLLSVEAGEIALATPGTAIWIDLDKFKSINDTYGHPAGDEALKHVANIIRQSVRERDRVYRISGDEFGVLCANFTEEEAFGLMRRVVDILSRRDVRWVSREGHVSTFVVSASIGVAEFVSNVDVKNAFQLADEATYGSKAAGRAMVTRASSLASRSE
jgi:diguanylate cyclase (GGDEF)-like protein